MLPDLVASVRVRLCQGVDGSPAVFIDTEVGRGVVVRNAELLVAELLAALTDSVEELVASIARCGGEA